MTDPMFTDGMRHAAEEADNTGNHLLANYLRTGAAEIDRLRTELADAKDLAQTRLKYLDAAMEACNRANARGTGLEAANNRASGALMSAAGQFRFYADDHTKKGAVEKAATNNGWADTLAREATEARSAAKAALDEKAP